MSRRTAVRMVCYFLSIIAVLGAFTVIGYDNAAYYRMKADYTYMSAFSQFTSSMSRLDGALKKSGYAGSPAMTALLSAEIWREASNAKAALSLLPLGEAELDDAQKFIAQSGEYAYTLLKKTASGEGLSDEERSNIAGLSASADRLSREVFRLKDSLNRGENTVAILNRQLAGGLSFSQEAAVAVGGAMDGGENLNGDFPAYASLIYDGPFSDHIEKITPALLTGKEQITPEEALSKISRWTGIGEENWVLRGGTEGKLKTWYFSSTDETIEIELTRQGGYLLNYTNSLKAGRPALTCEQAVEKAREFLSAIGYENMEKSYYITRDDIVTINFAGSQDGVICYPDLVQVSVCLECGHIASVDGYGYIMSRRDRELSKPTLTEQQAEAVINPSLTVLSRGLAVIPTNGKNELLCYEFKAEAQDKTRCIIYINADTGAEENIFILIEEEGGVLTI